MVKILYSLLYFIQDVDATTRCLVHTHTNGASRPWKTNESVVMVVKGDGDGGKGGMGMGMGMGMEMGFTYC